MNEKKYKITFSGVVLDGYDPARVKQNFLTVFKFDEKTIDKLFSGRTVVLKKQADYQTALSFQNKFKKAGAVCSIREIRSEGGAPVDRGREEQKRPSAVACPKCGHEQEESTECSRCGIIFSKFRQGAGGPAPTTPSAAFAASAGSAASAAALAPDESFDIIRLKNGVAVALFVSLAVVLGAFFMKDRLPDADPGIRDLYRFPVQTETEKKPFFVNVGDHRYTIDPLFDYELHGMVVTYYDSTGWWDVTHRFLWRDFLNIKDICVVYGLNARNGVYKDYSWKSGSWTCWGKPKRTLRGPFSNACVSNNHLLAVEKSVQKEILRAERGDIIRLKGFLAKYYRKSFSRGSSTTRYDSGDSSCETVFVEEFEILKKSNRFWRFLFTIATWILAGCLIAMIVIYIKEMRAPADEYETEAAGQAGYASIPNVKSGNPAGQTHKLKIIIQILVLLVLLYMWARVY